jgi:hypothetical protein
MPKYNHELSHIDCADLHVTFNGLQWIVLTILDLFIIITHVESVIMDR